MSFELYAKKLVTEICSDFDNGLNYSELVERYNLPIEEIHGIIDFYYYEVQ